jgi:hypothetical protein
MLNPTDAKKLILIYENTIKMGYDSANLNFTSQQIQNFVSIIYAYNNPNWEDVCGLLQISVQKLMLDEYQDSDGNIHSKSFDTALIYMKTFIDLYYQNKLDQDFLSIVWAVSSDPKT